MYFLTTDELEHFMFNCAESDLSYLFTVVDEYISVEENRVVRIGNSQVRVHSYLSYLQGTVLLNSF